MSTTLPERRVTWRPCVRLVSAEYPPVRLIEDAADATELDVAMELLALTDPESIDAIANFRALCRSSMHAIPAMSIRNFTSPILSVARLRCGPCKPMTDADTDVSGFFDDPIINSPYEVPTRHHDLEKGRPTGRPPIESRRRSAYDTPVPGARRARSSTGPTLDLLDENTQCTENPIINRRERTSLPKGTRGALEGWRGDKIVTLESEGEMLKRACGNLLGMKGVIVIDGEAHHCYRSHAGTHEIDAPKGDGKREAQDNEKNGRFWIGSAASRLCRASRTCAASTTRRRRRSFRAARGGPWRGCGPDPTRSCGGEPGGDPSCGARRDRCGQAGAPEREADEEEGGMERGHARAGSATANLMRWPRDLDTVP